MCHLCSWQQHRAHLLKNRKKDACLHLSSPRIYRSCHCFNFYFCPAENSAFIWDFVRGRNCAAEIALVSLLADNSKFPTQSPEQLPPSTLTVPQVFQSQGSQSHLRRRWSLLALAGFWLLIAVPHAGNSFLSFASIAWGECHSSAKSDVFGLFSKHWNCWVKSEYLSQPATGHSKEVKQGWKWELGALLHNTFLVSEFLQ